MCGACGWEVIAGNPEQKAPGSAKALRSHSCRNGLERPLVSWPGHTSCDLVIRALRVNFPKTGFEVTQFRKSCVEKKDPGIIYPVVHVSVTQWICDFEILNEPKCDHGVVKI